MSGLTILDILILGGLSIGVWRGTRTGAVKQLAGVVGVVIAFWLGVLLMLPAGTLIASLAGLPPEIAPLLGFVSITLIVLAAASVAAFLARRVLALFRLGFLDRGLGGVFGATRVAVVISVLLLISSIPPLQPAAGSVFGAETRDASVLYTPVRTVAPALWDGLRATVPGWHEELLERFGGPGAEASDSR
jgi:membrane protein required for colicin V production